MHITIICVPYQIDPYKEGLRSLPYVTDASTDV